MKKKEQKNKSEINIMMADYISLSNYNNECIGHGIKVLENNIEMLTCSKTHNIKLSIMAADNYIASIAELSEHYSIPYKAYSDKDMNVWQKWINIHRIFKSCNADFLWFTNIDWVLFMYIAIMGTSEKKVIVTMYRDIIADLNHPTRKFRHIRSYLATKAVSKIQLIVSTCSTLSVINVAMHLPDYYYSSKMYSMYECAQKKESVLCIGTMRKNKQIDKLVKAFCNKRVQLKVLGPFSSYEDYMECLKIAQGQSNISIDNRVLSYDEYYKSIAQYKYIVLPYDMNHYKNATSGILLESIFLKSIPIAPQKLLEFNEVNGIPYDALEDIPALVQKYENEKVVENSLEKYDINRINSIFIERIEEL